MCLNFYCSCILDHVSFVFCNNSCANSVEALNKRFVSEKSCLTCCSRLNGMVAMLRGHSCSLYCASGPYAVGNHKTSVKKLELVCYKDVLCFCEWTVQIQMSVKPTGINWFYHCDSKYTQCQQNKGRNPTIRASLLILLL